MVCFRKLTSFVVLMLFANWAAALGLGELTLKSTLNEPFLAEVKLFDVGDVTQEEVIAKLATNEVFATHKLDRPFFLSEFQFEVLLNASGGPVIRIRSKNSVREPYLGFVLDVRWPSGRLLREYSVLMDMPAPITQ